VNNDIVNDRYFFRVLQRFLHACKRSADRLKFVHLKLLVPETEGRGLELRVARRAAAAAARQTPPFFGPLRLDFLGDARHLTTSILRRHVQACKLAAALTIPWNT